MTARKRANGEGTIFWNEDRGRFEGMLDLGKTADGKRQRRKVTGATRAEVADRLDELKAEKKAGMATAGKDMSVAELLDRWITEVLPTKVDEGTVASYSWAAENHLKPGLGSRPVRRLTPEDVENFLRAKAKKLSRASLVRLRAVLGQALRWAEKRGYVMRNVATLADLPANARGPKEGRALTADEARRLLAAIDTAGGTSEILAPHRLKALWLVQITLGLRPGEVAGLRWVDVDLENGIVHVRSSLRWLDGRPSLVEPKTARSRRSLRIPAPVVDALRAHADAQADEIAVLGQAWPAEWAELVFTSEAGTPIDPANARRELRNVAKAAGLDGLRPYDLRHSAASLLAASGVPLEHVADVLGHDGLRMARLVYVHALSPSVDAAVAPMEALLAEG